MLNYELRASRIIRNSQWIQGKIKIGENHSTCDEAFNFFIEELKKGENLLNAKRNAQKKYNVPIEYDTEIPIESFKKSTLVVKVG